MSMRITPLQGSWIEYGRRPSKVISFGYADSTTPTTDSPWASQRHPNFSPKPS